MYNNYLLGQQKKDLARVLKDCFHSQDFDLIVQAKAIKSIQELCKYRAQVSIEILQGNKICPICDDQNKEIQYQQGVRCKKCSQNYHAACFDGLLQNQFDEQKRQIDKINDYEIIQEKKVSFSLSCFVCNDINGLPSAIKEKEQEYENKFTSILENRKEVIYDNILSKKKKDSSCQICNLLWISKQGDHQIFEQNILDDNNFKKQIEVNEDGEKKIKQFLRLSGCKHIFCKQCIQDSVFYNQVIKGNYNLTCQVKECNNPLQFSEIKDILSSRYNWLIKYKNQKFLVDVLKKLQGRIQFIGCQGIYLLDQQNCGGVNLKTRQEIVNCIKEIDVMKQNANGKKLNLKQIQSIKLTDHVKVQCCKRVYQLNREEDLDMKKIFDEELELVQDQEEKKEREKMYNQYLSSTIQPFPNPQNNQTDCYLIRCENESCYFEFCVNGCLEPHQAINDCPLKDQPFSQSRFNVEIDKLVKDIGKQGLYQAQNNEPIQLSQGVICYKCFRELKLNLDAEKGEDGEHPYQQCQCKIEFDNAQKRENGVNIQQLEQGHIENKDGSDDENEDEDQDENENENVDSDGEVEELI